MNSRLFFVLTGKEFMEQWRTSRFIILLAIFLFFGILSPMTAKFMPDIIASMVKSQNITIQLPEASWKDAIGQYVKNISQMGVFIIILLSMGIVAREKENGTAGFLLVKPVSRELFILSKFSAQFMLLLASMLLGLLSVCLYTMLFFGTFPVLIFTEISLILFVYLLVVQSVTLFFSIVIKTQIPAGILAFLVVLIMGLLSLPGKVGVYSPSHLIDESQAMMKDGVLNWQPF